MSEFSYIRLNRFMLARPRLSKATVFLCRAITVAYYIIYPLFVFTGFFLNGTDMIKPTLVPFISIFILSVIRAKLNLPRPYEQFDITPLYNKKTKGKSFPSRHTFAVFMISFTLYFYVHPIVFCVLLLLSIMLAALRVLIGVHLVRDVMAGFLFAVISALIGYALI